MSFPKCCYSERTLLTPRLIMAKEAKDMERMVYMEKFKGTLISYKNYI